MVGKRAGGLCAIYRADGSVDTLLRSLILSRLLFASYRYHISYFSSFLIISFFSRAQLLLWNIYVYSIKYLQLQALSVSLASFCLLFTSSGRD